MRHPYLQPYIAQCHNLSPVYLPTKSAKNSNNTPIQTRQSGKSELVKDEKSAKERLQKQVQGYPAVGRNLNMLRGSAVTDKVPKSEIPKANGEKKRLHGSTSFSKVTKTDGSQRVDYDRVRKTRSFNSRTSSRNMLTGQNENTAQLVYMRQKIAGESDVAVFHEQHRRMERSNVSLYINWLQDDEDEISPETTTILEQEPEALSRFCLQTIAKSSPKNVSTEYTLTTVSGNDERAKENDHDSSRKTETSNSYKINLAAGGISSTITQNQLNSSTLRIESDTVSQERADALESLLELCANLLKRKRIEELAGVLKPFGEETVSSRETAIWLTKGLLNIKKLGA